MLTLIPFTQKFIYKHFNHVLATKPPSIQLIEMEASANPLVSINDFELHDFIDETNFHHCINLIRGGSNDPVVNFDTDLINNCFVDNQFGPNPGDMYDFNATTMMSDPNTMFNTLGSFGDDVKDGDEDNDREDSSATTTTTTTTMTTPTKRAKGDRSRTLISERRRRGKMKEKLYSLRSLVPNITKVCPNFLSLYSYVVYKFHHDYIYNI